MPVRGKADRGRVVDLGRPRIREVKLQVVAVVTGMVFAKEQATVSQVYRRMSGRSFRAEAGMQVHAADVHHQHAEAEQDCKRKPWHRLAI